MLRIRHGDSTAFGILYRKYLPLTAIYAAALGGRDASVTDIVQETFARLWAHRQKYRGEASVKTYIHVYVRNICLEEKRLRIKTQVLSQRLSKGSLHWSSACSSPETAAHLKEMNEHLEQAIARLSIEQKQALRLYFVEDLPLREAAISMGCTQKCFESRLYRGLASFHPPPDASSFKLIHQCYSSLVLQIRVN